MDLTFKFYGYNREGADIKEGVQRNWWRQGMMGSIHAHYECVKAFSETNFTQDLKAVEISVLILHAEDDQIVRYENTAVKAAKLLKNSQLITCPGFPHGKPVTEAETINKDILKFIKP